MVYEFSTRLGRSTAHFLSVLIESFEQETRARACLNQTVSCKIHYLWSQSIL